MTRGWLGSVFRADAVERVPLPHEVQALARNRLEGPVVFVDLPNLLSIVVDFLDQMEAALVDRGELLLQGKCPGEAEISGRRRDKKDPCDQQEADRQPRGSKLFEKIAHAPL